MRTYVIPPTLKDEKEKIIGGVLDLTQAGWLMAGMAIIVGIFLLLSPVNKVLGLIVGVPIGATVSIVFGFLKIKGYTVLKYAKYKKAFVKKKKHLRNERKI